MPIVSVFHVNYWMTWMLFLQFFFFFLLKWICGVLFYFLGQVCSIRAPDAVWHYTAGRKKFQYFLNQPTSVTGAGRLIFSTQHYHELTVHSIAIWAHCPFYELLCFVNRDISFLCDALAAQSRRNTLPPMPDRAAISLENSQKASQS